MNNIDKSDLSDFIVKLRLFLEEKWIEWKVTHWHKNGVNRQESSQNMCGLSSLFLKKALEEEYKNIWRIAGGVSSKNGGFIKNNGEIESHLWVVCDELKIIIDITADQFGYSSIIITNINDKRYLENFSVEEKQLNIKQYLETSDNWYKEAINIGILKENNISHMIF